MQGSLKKIVIGIVAFFIPFIIILLVMTSVFKIDMDSQSCDVDTNYSAVSGNTVSADMKKNEKRSWEILEPRIGKIRAAAMIGNFIRESSINPTQHEINPGSIGDSVAGYGVIQFTPPTAMENWCKSKGLNPHSLEGQLSYILYDMEHGGWMTIYSEHRVSLDKFKKEDDIVAATHDFFWMYARGAPKYAAFDVREAGAKNVLATYGGSDKTTSDASADKAVASANGSDSLSDKSGDCADGGSDSVITTKGGKMPFWKDIEQPAYKWVGKLQYSYAGHNGNLDNAADRMNGEDCSGYVRWVLAKAGIAAPSVSQQQATWTKKINAKEAKAGDLIFFHITVDEQGGWNHVGLYVGDGKMIQMGLSGLTVGPVWKVGQYDVGDEFYGRVPNSAIPKKYLEAKDEK